MTLHLTDAGRSKSRRPNQKADCTVRAIAFALGFTYDGAYDLLKSAGRKCSRGFNIERWVRRNTMPDGSYWRLDRVPYVKDHHATGQAKRFRLQDFLKSKPTGTYIVGTAKHVFAVVDGVVYDDKPWHYYENRPVYAWLELHHAHRPLWQVYALRRPISKGSRRMVKRTVGLVEGDSYKKALRVASSWYEWAIRPNEDLHVEAYGNSVGGAV